MIAFSLARYLSNYSAVNLVILRCCFSEDAKKFTRVYDARAQLLFCSLNLLFSDVPVTIAVVSFLKLPNAARHRSPGIIQVDF